MNHLWDPLVIVTQIPVFLRCQLKQAAIQPAIVPVVPPYPRVNPSFQVFPKPLALPRIFNLMKHLRRRSALQSILLFGLHSHRSDQRALLVNHLFLVNRIEFLTAIQALNPRHTYLVNNLQTQTSQVWLQAMLQAISQQKKQRVCSQLSLLPLIRVILGIIRMHK
jgi:hypothetical protein